MQAKLNRHAKVEGFADYPFRCTN